MSTKSLAERRRALRLSQQALAERAACSVARVGQIERERAPGTDGVAGRIAAVLAELESRPSPDLPTAA